MRMSAENPSQRRAPLDRLLSVHSDLEPLEENLFRGRSPQQGWQRVFGGQVLGQALVAAVRTVPPERVAAFAARLLSAAAATPRGPIIYNVERVRDGAQLHHPARHRHPARPGRCSS